MASNPVLHDEHDLDLAVAHRPLAARAARFDRPSKARQATESRHSRRRPPQRGASGAHRRRLKKSFI